MLTDTVPLNVNLVIVNSTKAAYSQKEQFLPGIVLFGYRERHKQIEGWFLVGMLRNNLKVHPKESGGLDNDKSIKCQQGYTTKL